MKPQILLIGCATGKEPEKGLEAVVASIPASTGETTALSVSCPLSDRDAARISGAVAAGQPNLLLLAVPDGPVVEAAGSFLELLRRHGWRVPVVVCAPAMPHDGVELLKLGASEVVIRPSDLKKVIARLLLARDRCSDAEPAQVANLRATLGLEHIIGESPAFANSIAQIAPIAKYDVSVLILGETGTGKEVFARAIHYRSGRASRPFVPVNCGAIPVDLLENEFFGHESGAFTSANSSRRGVIKEADGGTLFLDEVDSLPLLAQVKILRFLQDGQFRPLGSASVCNADVRIIAASNTNFIEALASGRFRKDLYYRLNVLSLRLPPLREREEDIILLARHFLAKYTAKFRTSVREFSPDALQKLVGYGWPGNVRELENVIQRAVVLADEAVLRADHIHLGDAGEGRAEPQSFQQLKAKAIDQFEAAYIRRLLLIYDGNITKAAAGAGKDRRAFWELMRKHRIPARPSPSPAPVEQSAP
jgi:two-component system, NtrC family, response regulator GlrR